VRLPLVLYQACGRNNVGVGLRISRAGRIAAMLRIVAVAVLRSQSVHHKPQLTSALRAVAVSRAELRRPRKIQQVKVELPRCRLVLRTSSARSSSARRLIVPGITGTLSWLRFSSALRSHWCWCGVLAAQRKKHQQANVTNHYPSRFSSAKPIKVPRALEWEHSLVPW
jgi:hypothetical protein